MTQPPATAESTRAETNSLFREVIDTLESYGWQRLRVDTLAPPGSDPNDRNRWTVRHQYVGGTWELHYERDATWDRFRTVASVSPRLLRLTVGRALPSIDQALRQLFGDDYHRYFG